MSVSDFNSSLITAMVIYLVIVAPKLIHLVWTGNWEVGLIQIYRKIWVQIGRIIICAPNGGPVILTILLLITGITVMIIGMQVKHLELAIIGFAILMSWFWFFAGYVQIFDIINHQQEAQEVISKYHLTIDAQRSGPSTVYFANPYEYMVRNVWDFSAVVVNKNMCHMLSKNCDANSPNYEFSALKKYYLDCMRYRDTPIGQIFDMDPDVRQEFEKMVKVWQAKEYLSCNYRAPLERDGHYKCDLRYKYHVLPAAGKNAVSYWRKMFRAIHSIDTVIKTMTGVICSQVHAVYGRQLDVQHEWSGKVADAQSIEVVFEGSKIILMTLIGEFEIETGIQDMELFKRLVTAKICDNNQAPRLLIDASGPTPADEATIGEIKKFLQYREMAVYGIC